MRGVANICLGLGGETASLGVNYSATKDFHSAGYAPIVADNSKKVGGQVRQHGNFSFSRVYQAGHEVPAYQPEIAYDIFMRSLFNKDIATGAVSTAGDSQYSTKGPASSFGFKDKAPPSPEPECYIWSLSTCTNEQYNALLDGTAIVKDFIVTGIDRGSSTFKASAVEQTSSSKPLELGLNRPAAGVVTPEKAKPAGLLITEDVETE